MKYVDKMVPRQAISKKEEERLDVIELTMIRCICRVT